MKKLVILIVVILLCIAGWAGATYVVGGKVESQYTSLLDEFGQLGPLTMILQSYERGFLSSTARTVLELTIPVPPRPGEQPETEAPSETLRLVFESDVKHGPLPAGSGPGLARIETRLVSVTPDNETIDRLLRDFPQLTETISVTDIGFSGTMTDRVRLPALETSIDHEQIKWGGLSVDSSYSPGDKTIVGSFAMPGLEISGEKGGMTWQGLHGKLDLLEALPLLYLGTTDVEIGQMDLNFPNDKTGGQDLVQMKGFKISSVSGVKDKLVHFNQSMDFTGILLDGELYGPGRCVIDAKHLDGEVLGSFQQQLRELYRNAKTTNPDELFAQLLPLYTQMLLQLLDKNPEINISRFTFATPKGNIDGRLLVRFDVNREGDTQNPLAMLQALDASAELSMHESLAKLLIRQNLQNELIAAKQAGQIPDSFSEAELENLAVQQADAQLETLFAQQLVVRDGESIRSKATFRQGELVVNGQLLPLFQ